MFSMHPENVFGPDGMTALIYKEFWNIVLDDLVHKVNELIFGVLHRELEVGDLVACCWLLADGYLLYTTSSRVHVVFCLLDVVRGFVVAKSFFLVFAGPLALLASGVKMAASAVRHSFVSL